VNAKRAIVAALALALVGLSGTASSASASFHEMKIREVSSGTGTSDSSYVEVQMYAPGQTFLSLGAKLVRCDSTCSSPTIFQGFTDVAAGANQSTVLFGDSGVSNSDFTRDLNLNAIEAGGAVCYVSEMYFSDCMSWGNFSNDAFLVAAYGTFAGSPAPSLSSGMALRRSIAPGCPTLLEASDDTDNSATDFSTTTPDPRPNSVTPTEVACSTGVPSGYPNLGGSALPAKKKCKKAKHRSAASAAKKCKRRK
jgi:hypothetical protein